MDQANKKAIFINTASQVIVRFVTLAFTLVSIKLLAKYLGTHGVGEYNTITTYINFFIVIADLGFFSVTVREISKDPNNEKKIISNVFLIRLYTAILATLISIFVVFSTNYGPNIKLGTLIASGYIIFNLLSSVYDMVLQSRLKMQYSSIAELLSKLIAIIALFILIAYRANFYAIVSTITLSGLLIYLFKSYFASKFISFKPEMDRKTALWILSLSWPFGIIFFVNNLFFKVDTLMLFAIKGANDVGIYSVAYKIIEVVIFVGVYFASSLKPIFSKNITSDKKYTGDVLTKSIGIMLVAAAPITLICLLFSREIIIFISDQSFVEGFRALMIISLALPFMFLDKLLSEIMIANDERKKLIFVSVFALLFNFILNLLLIPRFSYLGAATVTLLSEISLFAVLAVITKKNSSVQLRFRSNFKTLSSFLAYRFVRLFIKIFFNLFFDPNFNHNTRLRGVH